MKSVSRLAVYMRLALALGFGILLSACATTGGDPSQEVTEAPVSDQQAQQQADEATDKTGQSQQTNATYDVAALMSLPDPMKKDLPLELIKGYDVAGKRLSAKDTNAAITQLSNLQLTFPKYSGPSYRMAHIHWQNKQYDDALSAVDQSLTINPQNYYAQNLKGIVLREQGKFAEARAAYEQAVKIYPAYAKSYLNLGILADIYLYDLPLALDHYQKYLALSGESNKKVSNWVIDLKRRMPKAE